LLITWGENETSIYIYIFFPRTHDSVIFIYAGGGFMMSDKDIKEYDKKWYQKNKERSIRQTLEWRKNNKEKYDKTTKKRLNSEKGFMRVMWQSIKDSDKDNSFKDFDDFYNHWLEQKKIYGMKCPGTGIEMTTKLLFNKKGKYKRCVTNISKDRVLNSKGYSRQNLIFTSWKYNNAKSSFTPEMAKAFLKMVEERYGVDDIR